MKRAIAILVLMLFPSIAFADADRAKAFAAAFPEVEKLFDAYLEKQHMRGAVMGIIVDGDLVWTRARGVQSAGGPPVTLETTFRIASMTKSFTAAAILQLRDEGKLELDDPVSKYIPELTTLAYPTSDSPVITIRHLLTHSEGFPEDNPWGDRQLDRTDEALSAWMKAGIPFSTTPGTSYEYSNYGFAILGQIVQRVSGQPYDVYMRTKILAPLGMQSATFEGSSVPVERKAVGYRWQDEQWIEEPTPAHGSFGAMGGLWMNGHDLARWVKFLMSAYPPRNDAESGPLKRSSAREMQELARFGSASARRSATDAPLSMRVAGYGYGLGVSTDCRFKHIVAHGGGLPGYGSAMTWLPQHGVGVIFMSNRTYGGATSLTSDVFDALRKTGALKPRPVAPSAALLAAQANASKLLQNWSDDKAQSVVADNFFLDKSVDRWKKETSDLVEKHGRCAAGTIEAENALRGKWRLTCEHGWIDVAMTLAPTTTPAIQYLNAISILPPDAALRAAIDTALKPAKESAFVSAFDLAKFHRQLASLEANWGKCTIGEPFRGDGKLRTSMKLECENGRAVLEVELDAESKKIKTVNVFPDADQTCVP